MKNDFLILIIFFAFLTIIAVGSDSYAVYQKHHTFQVAYESAMNCRTEQGKQGFSNSVDKICGSIPRWEDYSK